MSFPTTSVLDSFTRADASTLGASWITSRPGFTDPSLKISSDTAIPATAYSANMWAFTPGNDQEAFATMVALPTGANEATIFARAAASTKDWYQAHYVPGTGYRLFKCVGGAFTQLGTTDPHVASAGDKIGLQCVGTTITIWYTVSGVWTASTHATATDSAHASGAIGLGSDPTTTVFDDFGGGTVVVPSALRTLALLGVGA